MRMLSDFEKVIRASSAKPKLASDRNYPCTVPNCHLDCSIQLPAIRVMVMSLPWIQLVLCSTCKHPYLFHVHAPRLQSQRDPMHVTHNATVEVPRSGEDDAGPWPSWGLSARVERAIRLLDQCHTDMEDEGVSREQLAIMQRSLEQMKRILDLLRNAKQKVQKGTQKVVLRR